jgi:hypothetical protein
MALYIKVFARSYVTSCLLNLGWDTATKDGASLVPMPLSTFKDMANSPTPLNPDELLVVIERYGFEYRLLTGMLIFAVQIGRFDIAPAVTILCNFND